MRVFCTTVLLVFSLPGAVLGQRVDSVAAEPYRIYTAAGRPVSLDSLVAAMKGVEVVFLGEEHDDAATHKLQRQLLEEAYRRHGGPQGRPVVLSLEMFERDVQGILDEYLAGLITRRHFLRSSRPWPNYEQYEPLVAFAKAHGLPVIAANAPHRYVNRVARLGPGSLEVLDEEARRTLPPLPYPAPSEAYRADWERVMEEMAAAHPAPAAHPIPDAVSQGEAAPQGDPHHGPAFGLEAQMLRDAAMAHAIAQALVRRPEALLLHVTGGFHVERGTGTPEALARYRPGTRTLDVLFRPSDDPARFDPERLGALADFVILTPSAGQ